MKVVTVDQMQRIESDSDAAGHSYSAMMERAGRAVAQAVGARRDVRDKRVLILVGPGNNGGDGLVAARYLSEADAQVTCYLYKERSPAEDENFRLVLEGDVRAVLAEEDQGWQRLQGLVREVDILIDALLGTGTRLPLRGELADMLGVVSAIVADRRQPSGGDLEPLIPSSTLSGAEELFVVGVDGPTGLEYETGELDELAIPADLTVTFAYPKAGHFRFPGAGAIGELVVADIGIDPALAEDVTLEVVTPAMVREWLPPRPPDAHKGTFGKAMIVAGSVNYTGAAYLAGASATRAGAGLVTVALPSAIHSAVAARLAEATYVLLPHAMGVLSPDAANVLQKELEGYDVLLMGPGLGREEETVAFIEKLLGGGEKRGAVGFLSAEDTASAHLDLPPLVVDADGLNILSEIDQGLERLPPECILTPHPGEMARLMGGSVADVQADRLAVARSRAAEWRHVVVLKGAHTVVAGPDGRTVIEPFANPGLATAGTGDVLAGTIVALRAQGLGAFEAAAAGAYLHGLAGELARQRAGTAGMVAGDVLAYLPDAYRRVAFS
jgi:NAD(P)H-hydrate epimerase